MKIREMKIRVSTMDRSARKNRAAKIAVRFIRRQVEASGQPTSKEELAARMWQWFFAMREQGMLAAPRRTKSLLREKLVIWTRVGVDKDAA